MQLTSRDNAIIREIRRLLGDAKERRESGLFVLEGGRLCGEAAQYAQVRTVLYTARGEEQYASVLCSLRASGAQMIEITEALAKYIADTEHPQGVFCVCRMPQETTFVPRADGRYLALENVRDPGNLGRSSARRKRSASMRCCCRTDAVTCTTRRCCAAAWAVRCASPW